MTSSEAKKLKRELVTWVNQSDEDTLFMLDDIRQANLGKDWWDDLTEYQKKQIEEGLADIKAGRVYSSEEFWKRLRKSRRKKVEG